VACNMDNGLLSPALSSRGLSITHKFELMRFILYLYHKHLCIL